MRSQVGSAEMIMGVMTDMQSHTWQTAAQDPSDKSHTIAWARTL